MQRGLDRAAVPPPRAGLLHAAGLKVGCSFPADLSGLQYRAVICEIPESMCIQGLHSFVARVMKSAPEVVVAIIGEPIDVQEAVAAIRSHLSKDNIQRHDITVFSDPVAEDAPYLFSQSQLTLVSISVLPFKVCFFQVAHCMK